MPPTSAARCTTTSGRSIGEQPTDRLLLGQVVFDPARDDHGAGAAFAEQGTHAAAEKSRAAGDQDALAGELHQSARPERHSIDLSPASTSARS